MQLEGPTAAGLMYSDTGGDGPVVVLLHGVLMNGTLWDAVVEGLRDRYRCIVPELPFGAHTTPMPDDAELSLPALANMIAEFLTELDLRHVTVVWNDWGGAQLLISPGGTDRVANLVLVSCEAFDNYPPGLPGRLLCLNAALPGGTFLTAQLLRPALDPPSPRDLRRPVQAAGSRRPVQELDPPAATQPQGPPRPQQVPPQRPQAEAVPRVGRPAAQLRRPGPHRLATTRQAHAPHPRRTTRRPVPGHPLGVDRRQPNPHPHRPTADADRTPHHLPRNAQVAQTGLDPPACSPRQVVAPPRALASTPVAAQIMFAAIHHLSMPFIENKPHYPTTLEVAIRDKLQLDDQQLLTATHKHRGPTCSDQALLPALRPCLTNFSIRR